MSILLDTATAIRVTSLLITPYDQLKVYKLGIIDASGNYIKKGNLTAEENNEYTPLVRLCIKVRKLLEKSGIKGAVAIATMLAMIKENVDGSLEDILLECKKNLTFKDINQASIFEEVVSSNVSNVQGLTTEPTIKGLKKRKSINNK